MDIDWLRFIFYFLAIAVAVIGRSRDTTLTDGLSTGGCLGMGNNMDEDRDRQNLLRWGVDLEKDHLKNFNNAWPDRQEEVQRARVVRQHRRDPSYTPGAVPWEAHAPPQSSGGDGSSPSRIELMQHYHREGARGWDELISLFGSLREMPHERWHELCSGPFGLSESINSLDELLREAASLGLNSGLIMQMSAPLETIKKVAEHAEESTRQDISEYNRESLRQRVLDYVNFDLKMLKERLQNAVARNKQMHSGV